MNIKQKLESNNGWKYVFGGMVIIIAVLVGLATFGLI